MNTKPNRDITAETEHTKECVEFMAEDFRRDCICFMKPTTSTEWAKEIADPFYDESDPRPYEQLVFNINKLLTTRTDELLGAIDSFDLVEPCNPDCSPEEHAYHEGTWAAHLKLEKILATLRQKYSV